MDKNFVKIGVILLLVFAFFLAFRTYFKSVYFPSHPTTYSEYLQREDYDSTLDGKKIELLEPPVGGCINICWGKQQINSCQGYSRKWNSCEINCYGYVYNNCSSSKLGIIIGLISRLVNF